MGMRGSLYILTGLDGGGLLDLRACCVGCVEGVVRPIFSSAGCPNTYCTSARLVATCCVCLCSRSGCRPTAETSSLLASFEADPPSRVGRVTGSAEQWEQA